MERGGVNTVDKQHFTYLCSPARETSLTKTNIRATWRGSGLFPLNPDRILADLPKPSTELIIPNADEPRMESCPGYEVLPTSAAPISGEALTSLLDRVQQVPTDEVSN
jgi:hypothetical protein